MGTLIRRAPVAAVAKGRAIRDPLVMAPPRKPVPRGLMSRPGPLPATDVGESSKWLRRLFGDRPWEGLRAACDLRFVLEAEEERLVRVARAQHIPWGTIAWRLGVSRQAAHKKWAKRIGDCH